LRPGLDHKLRLQTRNQVPRARLLGIRSKPADMVRVPVRSNDDVEFSVDGFSDVLRYIGHQIPLGMRGLLRAAEVDEHVPVARRTVVMKAQQKAITESYAVTAQGQSVRCHCHRTLSLGANGISGRIPRMCSSANFDTRRGPSKKPDSTRCFKRRAWRLGLSSPF